MADLRPTESVRCDGAELDSRSNLLLRGDECRLSRTAHDCFGHPSIVLTVNSDGLPTAHGRSRLRRYEAARSELEAFLPTGPRRD